MVNASSGELSKSHVAEVEYMALEASEYMVYDMAVVIANSYVHECSAGSAGAVYSTGTNSVASESHVSS